MIEELRWKLAAKFMEMAHNQIEKGGFRNVKRGLKLTKIAISVMPYDEAMLAYMKMSWNEMIAGTIKEQES